MLNNTFRDMLFLMVMGFAFLVIWMLPHLNPPTEEADAPPPGNVIAYIEWPPGNVDVDLWITGPDETAPIGYSNMNGRLWNLLRDDTGVQENTGPSNFENAYTRGVPAGEYIVNVHCYRCSDVIPVILEVSIKPPGATHAKITPIVTVVYTSVRLQPNQEVTMIRFEIGADGKVIPDSKNHIYQRLRAMGTTAETREGGWHP